jgi:hypothetical protein
VRTEHLKHNAFRCLRESGFDPVQYAISHPPLSADIERGLLEYAQRERRWPAANGLGILPFGKTSGEWTREPWEVPAMLTPKFQVLAYLLIFAPLLLAAALFAWSFRAKTKQ